MKQTLSQKHKKILSRCILASLFLHAIAVGFLQNHSLWFPSSEKKQTPELTAPWISRMEKMERDQILKEAFEPAAPQGSFTSTDAQPKPESLASAPIQSRSMKPLEFPDELLSFSLFQSSFPFPANELLASNRTILPTFSLPKERFNLLEHLPKDLIVPAPMHPTTQAALLPPPPLPASNISLTAAPPTIQQEAPSTLVAYSEPLLTSPQLTENAQAGKAPSLIPLPSLPKLPSLADLETASYSESFDAELVFLPREDGPGYIFAVTLIPRPDLDLPKIRQHFTFLIDRSNSMQAGRLAATKSAVHKAFEELSAEDTFNIIAFDSKIEKLSPISLPCNTQSFAAAEKFLDKINLGSFFSSGDLYKPLFLTVPGAVKNDELYTAILLTDGENLVKKNAQRSILFDWTYYNAGKVTLFAIGMNQDAHLSTLDAAAVFNKGKLIHSPSNRGLKRKLLKLMKTICNPVAKNLACKAISRSPKAKIELYPKTEQMPHLYLDQPFVILGTTDTLDDFILFVQGRLKDRWLNIKKAVSFLNGKKGSQSLKAEWALQQAYRLYEKYSIDQNPQHLAEANAILEPYDHQTAFK